MRIESEAPHMMIATGILQLHAIFGKLRVFLGRPAVQFQLVMIMAVMGLAWFASREGWRLLDRRTAQRAQRRVRIAGRPLPRFLCALLRTLTFPLFALALLQIIQSAFMLQGVTAGLFGKVAWIIWTMIALQTFVTVLSAIFEPQTIRVYHFRLFLPLAVIVVMLKILGNLTDLHDLANTVLAEVFNNPVTLGAFFVATVGLYFWTDAAHVFQDLTYQLAVRHTGVDPGGAMAALTLIRYILISMGVLFVLSQLKLGPTTLAAITGGLSVGVGFGLREILSNLISGILLLFEQSLHPGDVIEVDDEITVVEDVRMRATIVRTQNNDELVIPNQTFFTSSFKTYTGTDKTVRVPIVFRTDCATPPHKVVQVLIQTALSHEQVLRDPLPTVFLLDYGDNTAKYQLNIWLDNPILNAEVASDVRLLVWDAFEANDIALPFPEIELHLPKHMAPEFRPVFTS